MNIQIDEGGYMPVHAHPHDAGYDLFTPELFAVPAGGSWIVDLRIHIAIPVGWFGKIESKSGLLCKASIVAPGGTIDSGYTGSIKVKLENHSNSSYMFERGDKIAQIVFIPCGLFEMHQVPLLPETVRGDHGFGSTGK